MIEMKRTYLAAAKLSNIDMETRLEQRERFLTESLSQPFLPKLTPLLPSPTYPLPPRDHCSLAPTHDYPKAICLTNSNKSVFVFCIFILTQIKKSQ